MGQGSRGVLANTCRAWRADPRLRPRLHAVPSIDTEEYPSTEKIKEICVSMLADLWHAGEHWIDGRPAGAGLRGRGGGGEVRRLQVTGGPSPPAPPASSTTKPEHMLSLLANNPWAPDKTSKPTGTDTVGSSEAVLLGGLALKRRWQDRRKAAGKDTSKPNIVMGTETHVVGGRAGEKGRVSMGPGP